jgi:hypothetical protein
LDSEEQKTRAQACERIEKQGKVLIVNFGSTTSDVKKIRETTQDLLQNTTKSTVEMTVSAVEATASAKKAHQDATRDTTCELHDTAQWAATAAVATMPMTKDSDIVIALSDKQSCSRLAGTYYGNLVEVFVNPELNNKISGINQLTNASLHEIFHIVGLGHAGTLDGNKSGMFEYISSHKPGGFNVNKYLAKNNYFQEYGDAGNIMAINNPYSYSLPILAPVQLDDLQWPELTLRGQKGEIVSGARKVDAEGVQLMPEYTQHGTYGVLDLRQPYELVNADTDESKLFDRIAFVPVSTSSSVNEPDLITVYATGTIETFGTTIKLGTVSVKGNKPATLLIKDKVVTIQGGEIPIIKVSPELNKIALGFVE